MYNSNIFRLAAGVRQRLLCLFWGMSFSHWLICPRTQYCPARPFLRSRNTDVQVGIASVWKSVHPSNRQCILPLEHLSKKIFTAGKKTPRWRMWSPDIGVGRTTEGLTPATALRLCLPIISRLEQRTSRASANSSVCCLSTWLSFCLSGNYTAIRHEKCFFIRVPYQRDGSFPLRENFRFILRKFSIFFLRSITLILTFRKTLFIESVFLFFWFFFHAHTWLRICGSCGGRRIKRQACIFVLVFL